MKKILMLLLVAIFSFSIHAVEDIEKLMVEKAESPQEKKAIYNYLKAEAAEKHKLAKKLRQIAKTSKGGKVASQKAHKEEMLKEAEDMDALAKKYEELAEQVKP